MPSIAPNADRAESTSAADPRILVFVVAYEAERHLCSVFERVPENWLHREDVHFVCIDDASTDGGADLLRDWLAERNVENVTILKNRANQGYGGNQKLGYRIAVDGGYDFVILLHGDGQYAPEMLPEFERQWRESDADVVLGTRMHSVKSARAGGMPWYKVFGNRFLTWFQNKFTGLGLSEYHTGFRGYSTRFLSKVPFELNTSDFHFDTEILLQAANVEAKIVEFPIPTHYGDEKCRVNGVRYAWDVVRATVGYRLHRLGVFCSLLYRGRFGERYQDESEIRYACPQLALKIVENLQPKRVVDIGCGHGHVARECRNRTGAHVVGVDGGETRPDDLDEFHCSDFDADPFPLDVFDHDVVLFLDVIERLVEPERFLLSLRHDAEADAPAPTFLISTPNVAFAGVRLAHLCGRFTYAERGILNVAHRRLFTRSSLLRALRSCGYEVHRVHAIGAPFEAVVGGTTGRLLAAIGNGLAYVWPTMFAFQFLVECEPRPGARQVLAAAARIKEDERNPLPASTPGSREPVRSAPDRLPSLPR